jgi:trimeric autotransporter adhesin
MINIHFSSFDILCSLHPFIIYYQATHWYSDIIYNILAIAQLNGTIMKKYTLHLLLIVLLSFFTFQHQIFSQNKVGVGTTSPAARLHIRGEENISQLCIDADTQQTNLFPLICLRNSEGTNLMWIHADITSNSFIGLNAGRINNSVSGIQNTFLGSNVGYSNTTGTNNTAVGYSSLYTNSTGYQNTAIGANSLRFNTTGINNTAMGFEALKNDYGDGNTALGSFALKTNSSGIDNTAVGLNALYSNSSGTQNTAIGVNALYSNNFSSSNTAVGYQALYANVNGSNNSAFGVYALWSNTSGHHNTALGSLSLVSNTSGIFNTATGDHALSSNTTGDENTGIGKNALFQNTDGNNNTAVGSSALYGNGIGTDNTAVGVNALAGNDSSNNSAVGANALESNGSGNNNAAMGYFSLKANTTGTYNSAYGSNSLRLNTTGSGNAAFGFESLYSNTTQIQNTACGNETLHNTTASGNTAVGFLAGHDFDNGDYNTFLGIYTDANGAGYTNSTAIGSSTDVTASNQVRIGTSVSSIGGPQNWTNTSDARIKTNVRADVHGLDFIKILQPVTYNKSIALEDSITGHPSKTKISEDNDYEKIRYSGFIAQDVEAAARSIGYEFSGIDAPKNEKDLYGLRYAEFVVPLVKAVQELSDENAMLRAELKELQLEVSEVKQILSSLKNDRQTK